MGEHGVLCGFDGYVTRMSQVSIELARKEPNESTYNTQKVKTLNKRHH